MYTEEKATKKYIEIQLEIEAQIKKLQTDMATHNEKAGRIDWGHVGDLTNVLAHLKQLNLTEDEE